MTQQLYVLMRIEYDIDSEGEVRGVYDSVEKAEIEAENECFRVTDNWVLDNRGCEMLFGFYLVHDEGPIEIECYWKIIPCELNQTIA